MTGGGDTSREDSAVALPRDFASDSFEGPAGGARTARPRSPCQKTQDVAFEAVDQAEPHSGQRIRLLQGEPPVVADRSGGTLGAITDLVEFVRGCLASGYSLTG